MGDAAKRIADSLVSGKNVALFLGNFAQHHPAATQLHALVQTLADLLGAKFGFLGEAANSVGGYLASAVAGGGLDARQLVAQPRKAYVLLGVEPELDCCDPQQAMAAMKQAEFVVALSPYQHGALDYAHALLPIAPFTETSGTFVSTEGRVQSFRGVVQPLAQTRPAWKVLRVLGNLLGVRGVRLRQQRSGVEGCAGRRRCRVTPEQPPVQRPSSATVDARGRGHRTHRRSADLSGRRHRAPRGFAAEDP